MNPRYSFLLAGIVLFFWCAPLDAQIEDLRTDSTFFKEQMQTYQRWLDHSGLGEQLRVRDIRVKKDQLSLYLEFPYADIDSILNAWNTLKTTVEAQRPITLEQQLFYKMTALMEVRQSLADVQVYDTYDTRREPLFFRGIYFADGQVQVEETNPMSEIRDIAIRKANMGRAKALSSEEFQVQYSRQQVYTKILDFARNKFETRTCVNRNPKLTPLEMEEVLRFEVTDLCKVVLVDETNPVICDWLIARLKPCNWIKRELLTFTVVYEPRDYGFNLNVEIDGKVGSGIYERVRRGGYYSMEVDFDDYLKRYADAFCIELKQIF